MKKQTKIILFIILAVILVIIGIVLGAIKSNKEKLISMNSSPGYGYRLEDTEVTIYENGKVLITTGEKNAYFKNKKKFYVDKSKINELKDIINENADKIKYEECDRLDYGSTEIILYENGKEKESFKDNSVKKANENFSNIAEKIREIRDSQ